MATSPTKPRSATDRDYPDSGTSNLSDDSQPKALDGLLWSARIMLMALLAYMAWRFGGVETVSLWHASLATSLLIAIVVFACVAFRWRPTLPPFAFVVIPLAFICYSIFQSIALPKSIAGHFSAIENVRLNLGAYPADEIEKAALSFGATVSNVHEKAAASVIPQASRIALVPIIVATLLGWLTAILFESKNTKTAFLWFVLLNASALSAWGIVQRANHSVDILPGIPDDSIGQPFASFYYRNAGAAAILPGIAAATALFYMNRKGSRDLSYGQMANQNGWLKNENGATSLLSARDLTLISLACLLLVAVIVSLSRGAWIAGGCSLILAVVALRADLKLGKGLLFLALLASVISIATYKITVQLQARMDRVSVDDFASDDRLSHWKEGWAAACSFFPYGSGLGTYGYATLPHQVTPRDVWFREAHNQYLQVLTESGLIGAAALLLAIGWMLKHSLQHTMCKESTLQQGVGLFGLMTLVLGVVQSIGDFVIDVPANLLLYGTFFGLVAAGPGAYKPINQPVRFSQKFRTPLTVLIFGIMLGCAIRCVAISSDQLAGDKAIDNASLADLKDAIDSELIDERIAGLDQAISLQPDRAALYHHRAAYRLAKYQASVISAGSEVGETIAWGNAQPERMFVTIASLPVTSQAITIASLVETDALKEPLELALTDLAAGLRCNPLFSQLHLKVAALSPLVNLQAGDWLERASVLSLSDPDKMYVTGLLAYYADRIDIAHSQWKLCLVASDKYSTSIFEQLLKRNSAPEIGLAMIPPEKPQLFVNLVKTALTIEKDEDGLPTEKAKRTARQVAEILAQSPGVSDEQRNATLGVIYDMLEDSDASSAYWVRSLDFAPENSNYRWKAAESLYRANKLDEALRHAILGSTLTPNDTRFTVSLSKIRAKIAKPTR